MKADVQTYSSHLPNRSAAESSGEWLSLMDYATQNGVSLSTLRRHIKLKKVAFRIENGRYLIQAPVKKPGDGNYDQLRMELQKAKEEIAELKTLIALYEEKIPQQRLDY